MEVIEAPIETVWDLLTNPAGWGGFYDMRVVKVDPPGPMTAGQRLIGETGPRWLHLDITFEFTRIDPEQHKLEFVGQLPFGLKVHEALDCTPLDGQRCRVNYHCNFELPPGWKGALLRRLLGRGFDSGPADSLQRLKRAAEHAYAAPGSMS
jgi:hypothetical protein